MGRPCGQLMGQFRLSNSFLFSHQFFRSADCRQFKAVPTNHPAGHSLGLGISNMPTVPSQQVLGGIRSRSRNMKCIACSFARNRPFSNKDSPLISVCPPSALEHEYLPAIRAASSPEWHPAPVSSNTGSETYRSKCRTAQFPPIARELLVGSDQQVSARSRNPYTMFFSLSTTCILLSIMKNPTHLARVSEASDRAVSRQNDQ